MALLSWGEINNKAMLLSLSGASSFAVSYLDDFASIATFFPGAPFYKHSRKIQSQRSQCSRDFYCCHFIFCGCIRSVTFRTKKQLPG